MKSNTNSDKRMESVRGLQALQCRVGMVGGQSMIGLRGGWQADNLVRTCENFSLFLSDFLTQCIGLEQCSLTLNEIFPLIYFLFFLFIKKIHFIFGFSVCKVKTRKELT